MKVKRQPTALEREFAVERAASLEQKVYELEIKIENLERELSFYERFSNRINGLTRRESKIISLLMHKKSITSRQEIMDFLFIENPDSSPKSENLISVHIFKIRKKLHCFNIEIESCISPGGYFITEENKAKIRALNEAPDKFILRRNTKKREGDTSKNPTFGLPENKLKKIRKLLQAQLSFETISKLHDVDVKLVKEISQTAFLEY